jgi:hypothetical protein
MQFQSESDLVNERMIMESFACGHPFKKLDGHDVDFVIPNRCYVEVKARKFKHNRYPVEIISLIKLVKLQEKGRILPAFLVFGFTDCIGYIEVNDVRGNVRLFGRKPRKGSTNDMELMLFISKDLLTFKPKNYTLIDSKNQLKH